MWDAIVAVVGTLAGALVTGVMAQRQQRAQQRAADAAARRTAQLDAVTALAGAVSGHRLAMWERERARLEGEDAERVRELREASHVTRSAITDPAVRLRLLVQDAGVQAAAEHAVQVTYRMRHATDLEALSAGREDALAAHDELVATAGAYLAG